MTFSFETDFIDYKYVSNVSAAKSIWKQKGVEADKMGLEADSRLIFSKPF
jgi:hypothetical protein